MNFTDITLHTSVVQASLLTFIQTILQSIASSVFSILLGIVGASGLLFLSQSRFKKAVEILFLIPNFLPSLFILISTLQMFQILNSLGIYFPLGFWGVVIIHTLINAGLISVALTHQIESRLGTNIELAIVEGASFWRLWRAALGALRSDLWRLSFFVFVFSFSSFSIPLVVGQGGGETLEVLIYKTVIGEGNIKFGIILALLQLVFLALISRYFQKPIFDTSNKKCSLKKMSSLLPLVLFSLIFIFLIISSTWGMHIGWAELSAIKNYTSIMFNQAIGTAIESALVAILVFLISSGLIYLFIQKKFRKKIQFVFSALTSPNAVLIGLLFYLFFNFSSILCSLIIVSFAFALTIYPSLFRLNIGLALQQLSNQIESAQILGASHKQIFLKISLPLIWRDLLFVSGLAGFWASGDFALSKLILGKDLTLAMTAHTLLSGYHLEAATFITACTLFIGLIIFLISEVLGHVCYSKSYL
jgi:thiamine transport system permease protein